ncbi:HDIG domain-containing metalloprotein [Boseongicola sp. H5]|uniref:HDIG domain-containing metalloprotein n=1 Tax=Boseongicola sp. H5 TaxID=2763261 RepID=UPI001D0B8312|nr:HDIG domain-containing metalloprotein [Boseongicola sp. H5]
MHKSAKPTVTHQQLLSLVPTGPIWQPNWDAIWSLWPELAVLDDCPQDPIHHAEGNAGIHTRMVVEALISNEEWQSLPSLDHSYLFWAAVLHDIGKPAVTKHEEDGRIFSRGHSRVGRLSPDNGFGMQVLPLRGGKLCAGSSTSISCHSG